MAAPTEAEKNAVKLFNILHAARADFSIAPGGGVINGHFDTNVVMGRADPKNDLERHRRATEFFDGIVSSMVDQKIIPQDRRNEVTVSPQTVMLSHSPGDPHKIHDIPGKQGASFTYVPTSFNGPTETVRVQGTLSIPSDAVNMEALKKCASRAQIMASGGQSYKEGVAEDRANPGTRNPAE